VTHSDNIIHIIMRTAMGRSTKNGIDAIKTYMAAKQNAATEARWSALTTKHPTLASPASSSNDPSTQSSS